MKDTCNQFRDGCRHVVPNCDKDIVQIGDGRWGYRPASCGRDCICGFYPVYDSPIKFEIQGYECLEKTPHPGVGTSTSSRLYLPPGWAGKRVVVVRQDP